MLIIVCETRGLGPDPQPLENLNNLRVMTTPLGHMKPFCQIFPGIEKGLDLKN